ncbi:MAG: hypothetical protein KA275_04940 [Chitinophagaceae bacterium]|nr:hypothetical protein [Chitinophagaceae bacterium]
MNKTKIVFLGAKPIACECLQFLLNNIVEFNIEIIAISTKENKAFDTEITLENIALMHNIPLFYDVDEMPLCDIIISVQYPFILKQKHIEKATKIAVNLHMAPLPEYRGCNQFSFAILEEKKEFGATLHLIDEGIDSGAILFEERFPIPENCWVNDLFKLTFEASIRLFESKIFDIINENFVAIPQNDLVHQRETSLHFRNEINRLKEIDISLPKNEINKIIRATSMPGFESPYFFQNGKKIFLEKLIEE